MKKKLNTQAITNELKQGSVFFSQRPTPTLQDSEPKSKKKDQEHKEKGKVANKKALSQVGEKDNQLQSTVNRPVGQSADQSTGRSVDQSTNQLTGKVVDRPVSFYIPIIINHKIDEAVTHYRENFSKSIDRSAVISALLGKADIWTDEALNKLADEVISQLTSRLIGRQTGRSTD